MHGSSLRDIHRTRVLVQRIESVSGIRERRHDFVPHASLPFGIRIQCIFADGRCPGHSVQHREDTAVGGVVETLAGNYKRCALPDRRRGPKLPGLRARFRRLADEKEHRLSRCVQRRGAL